MDMRSTKQTSAYFTTQQFSTNMADSPHLSQCEGTATVRFSMVGAQHLGKTTIHHFNTTANTETDGGDSPLCQKWKPIV